MWKGTWNKRIYRRTYIDLWQQQKLVGRLARGRGVGGGGMWMSEQWARSWLMRWVIHYIRYAEWFARHLCLGSKTSLFAPPPRTSDERQRTQLWKSRNNDILANHDFVLCVWDLRWVRVKRRSDFRCGWIGYYGKRYMGEIENSDVGLMKGFRAFWSDLIVRLV